jgi:hypothetical protein
MDGVLPEEDAGLLLQAEVWVPPISYLRSVQRAGCEARIERSRLQPHLFTLSPSGGAPTVAA